MSLVPLELEKRLEVGIRVPETDDQSDRDPVVLGVINEAAPVGRGVERPASAMHDEPRNVRRGVDLPQLLDADAPRLRIAAGVEFVACDHGLAEMTARALREQRVFAQKLDARLEVGCRLAIFADTHVARGDAAHRTIVVVEHFSAREPGEDLDAERLRLLTQDRKSTRLN